MPAGSTPRFRTSVKGWMFPLQAPTNGLNARLILCAVIETVGGGGQPLFHEEENVSVVVVSFVGAGGSKRNVDAWRSGARSRIRASRRMQVIRRGRAERWGCARP